MSESASKRILMVEDEEDIAFLIRYMLERHGFVVDHAADGRQALDHFAQAAPPDLTLMDIMLPYHDGLELIERLRAQAGWESVPVLMLTAKAREVDIVRALELGADDYVTKPFQPEELLARIRRLLRGAGEARAAAACPGDTLHHGFGGYRHGRATGAGAATDAAEATLRAHPAQHPEDADAQFLLARVLSWQGRPEQALPIYQRLLRQQPDNADYLLGEGQALLWAGRPQRALASLERAARIAPDYAEVQQVIQQARAALTVPTTATAPVPVTAAATKRRHELEISARQDWLDSGFDNWRSQRLDYTSTRPESLGWYGALLREQRFGEWDEGVEAGAVIPLDDNWTLQPEVGYQPSPYFLPEWHADLRLQRRLADGYLGAVSVRRTEYEATRVDRLALSAERYWNAWRAGYTLNVTDVANAGTPIGHDLALDYYYRG